MLDFLFCIRSIGESANMPFCKFAHLHIEIQLPREKKSLSHQLFHYICAPF